MMLIRQKYKINNSSNPLDYKNYVYLTNFINNVKFYTCFMYNNTFPVGFISNKDGLKIRDTVL